MFLLDGSKGRVDKGMSEQLETLREISRKLDQLIILTKLSNLDIISGYKSRIRGDRMFGKILDYSDGSLSYSDLCDKVSKELGVAEITVMKKISELKEMGFLVTERRGRKVYYDTSGLFE
jgi:DNA-binding transcriptional ArsR family regulator